VHSHTAEIASKLTADAKAKSPESMTHVTPPPVATQPAPAAPTGPRTWEGFIDHVRKTRPLLASILEHGSDTDLDEADQRLALFYKAEESYYLKQLQVRTYLDQFQSLSKEYFGKPIRLVAEMMGEGKDSSESLADKKTRMAKERQEEARSKAQNHPIIREAQSLFGGELGPIELSEPNERAGEGGHADGA
jgi:DNA polymerase-3 subunit gamma/tau